MPIGKPDDGGPAASPGRSTRLLSVVAVVTALVVVAAVIAFVIARGSPTQASQPAVTKGPACAPVSKGGPLLITAGCIDPVLDRPYTDTDQTRRTTDPQTGMTVSYRYVHGGFKGTDARFSLYLPAKSKYQGRFFESTYPTVSEEDADPQTIVFGISEGAYVVSTNNAGGVQVNATLGGYRVNATSAKYSEIIARQMYGHTAPIRGYLFGASGGAYQTVSAMEATSGVWSGAVPMVFGAPNAIPSFMTGELLALRVLKGKFPQIVDAMAPGGSGDPYAGLSPEQREVLAEVTKLGFPLRGWWQYATLNGGAFYATEGGVKAFDSSYVTDFWTKAGYEGSQPGLRAARITQASTVVRPQGSPVSDLVLSKVPSGELVGADLQVTSGSAKGTTVGITSVEGDDVGISAATPSVAKLIRPGDQVQLDNSWLLALEYYQRHQLPPADEYGWNQFRGGAGAPLYPQRSTLVGPTFARLAGGSVPNGHFHGKMIMLGSTMDVQAYPWSEDWYRSRAANAFGSGLDSVFRLWYMDNADHDPTGPAALATALVGGQVSAATNAAAHIVSYTGEMEQALLDLDNWVHYGTAPPASTSYRIDSGDQVQVAATATQRHGLQPVPTLRVVAVAGRPESATNDRLDVAAGQTVTFSVTAQSPPGGGQVIKAEWDFLGVGTYPVQTPIRPAATVTTTASFSYPKPGTYFPVVRVSSQRQGNPTSPWGVIENLASVRVVVH